MMKTASSVSLCLALLTMQATAFTSPSYSMAVQHQASKTILRMAEDDGEEKAAPLVSGEQLEMLMTEWDQPLVVDAYATWCGPCLLMAPEFESAAQELKGKVRFAKLDTDKDEQMASQLNIMGLPTLLFLDKFEGDENANPEARAVLKGKIEGALRKDNIKELCEFYFFDGPQPKLT
eukprot:CAMPEP_0198116428 /NCGR_PEP_ID=MMETSP1442-20131203/12245_1 /TAXON_ID= /ORGANISM="Craspedostauros australis, Strain CCMP3328" /LENGTH=176 /DNA_ID=CAMNT_0043774241 /DNA_START=111 /DNA_END=641 /DNA_ORIENTATION=+